MAEKMSELNKNITAYEKMDSEWIVEHTGKIALLSDGKLIDIFNDLSDAYKVGIHRFGEGKFSVKEIGTKAQSLGIISCFAKPCLDVTHESSV